MSRRVQLRRDAGRVGPNTGPWIRRRQLGKVLGPPVSSELAEVVDHRDATVGWGLVSDTGAIAIRVVAWGAQRPSEDWLSARIAEAARGRAALHFAAHGTTGYRLINSEGDGLPGLVVDDYGRDRVVQITTAPMLALREPIMRALQAHGEIERTHVIVPESAAKREGIAAEVSVAGDVTALSFDEEGLRFVVDAPPAQKTGAYFDQRANRRWVAELAARTGGALLDVGCHVGGFALHAATRGVRAVGLDSSARVLARAAANAAARNADVVWVQGDMFGGLREPELQGPFGTIVVDPPKLAVRRSDVDRAVSAMAASIGHLASRVTVGGHLVLCTCSHHLGGDQLDRALNEGGRETRWTRVRVLGADVDHPVAPGHREGEYLVVHAYQRRG